MYAIRSYYASLAFQLFRCIADFSLPGEEDQDVAPVVDIRDPPEGAQDMVGQLLVLAGRQEEILDRVGAALVITSYSIHYTKLYEAGRENARLFRMEGFYAISRMMPADYVANYYFFFPDPWPKARHHDHRLFNPAFMDALHRTLEQGGGLHIATDHLPYFEEIHALLRDDARFDEAVVFAPDDAERTDFELIFAHKRIGRCSFRKH